MNYPFLVVGTCLLLNQFELRRGYERGLARLFPHSSDGSGAGSRWHPDRTVLAPHAPKLVSAFLLGLLALFLYRAQLHNYRQFAPYNLTTTAYAKALNQVFAAHPDAPRRVTLDNPTYDAQVRVRLLASDVDFGGYTDLVASLKSDNRNADSEAATAAVNPARGFEHAARLGLSREKYEAELLAEIDGKYCWPRLMYHFSFLECAPYVSDFRAYIPSKLKQAVPSIVESYRQHLLADAGGARAREALVLTLVPLEGPQKTGSWNQEQIGTTQLTIRDAGFAPAQSAKVYAYWQRQKS